MLVSFRERSLLFFNIAKHCLNYNFEKSFGFLYINIYYYFFFSVLFKICSFLMAALY